MPYYETKKKEWNDQNFSSDISLAVIMLIYNHLPDEQSLRISENYANKVILINNNSNIEITNRLKKLIDMLGKKFSLIDYSVNKGISKAYNEAVTNITKDIDYIFLFDHDAIFTSELFIRTLKTLKTFKNERIGVIVPIVSDNYSLMGSKLGFSEEYSIIDNTITSGIFMRRDLFLSNGGYDENLFVEAADLEFTKRISKQGYLLVRMNTVLIVQEFELPVTGKKILFRIGNFIITIRSIIRIKFNNCNIYRTRMSFYNEVREKELNKNLSYLLRKKGLGRLNILVIIFLNKIETKFVTILNRLTN